MPAITLEPGSAKEQAYKALRTAAERIGANNYARGTYKIMRTYRGRRYEEHMGSITRAHQQIVDAMPALLADKITPEEAMALLWDHDVMEQRLWQPKP